MQGWKAFRTRHGHTAKHTREHGFVIPEHEGSPLFRLNVPTSMPDSSPVWFCATREDACGWAEILGYNYVAPVHADINVKHIPEEPPKYTALQITRTGKTGLSGIKPSVALYTAFRFNDIQSAVDAINYIAEMKDSIEKSKQVERARDHFSFYMLLHQNENSPNLVLFKNLMSEL